MGGGRVILLDTHALVWFADKPSLLSARARRAVEEAFRSNGLIVSQISYWEVAMLVARNRLDLSVPIHRWLEAVPTFRRADSRYCAKATTVSGETRTPARA